MANLKIAKKWNNKDKTELYERIVSSRYVFGKTYIQIGKENGVSDAFAIYTCQAFEAVKKKDWDKAKEMISNKGQSYLLFDWSAKKLGIDLPPDILQTYIEARKIDAEKKRAYYERRKSGEKDTEQLMIQEEPEPEHQPEPAPAPAEIPPEIIVEKKLDNTALYLIKILEALVEQNELLKQLMDAVIPHWIDDLKQNNNANGDAIQEMLKPIAASLDAIRCNTKKRGL